jgi:hypothetical protein
MTVRTHYPAAQRKLSLDDQLAAALSEARGQAGLRRDASLDTRIRAWGSRKLGLAYAPPPERVRPRRELPVLVPISHVQRVPERREVVEARSIADVVWRKQR